DGGAVVGEYGPGERVGRRSVDQVEHRMPVRVRIGKDGEDRPEELALEQIVVWVRAGEDGGVDEPADIAVALAAGDEREIRIGARRGQHRLVLAKAWFVDDRAHERAELRGVSNRDRLGGRSERFAQLVPD